MIHELDEPRYPAVRALFAALAVYNVSIPALLDGINPGTIYVDDPVNPRTALMHSVEGSFLVGDAANGSFIEAVNTDLRENHYNDAVTVAGDFMFVGVHPETWIAEIPHLFHPRMVFSQARRHYVCTALAYDQWREHVPAGFAVRRINDDLLDTAGLDVPDHIHDWISHNWGTRENYRAHGFGFCVVNENQVVSWSVADCASGTRCEIGIQTRPDYRRRGLAAITTAACVEYALSNAFTEVGWHCNDDNAGSWKTAEKVGFVKERDYTLYYSAFSSVHEIAEMGYVAVNARQYQAAVDAYDQLFVISDDYPSYIYHTAARAYAALNNFSRASACLNAAVDRGWADLEFTGRCEEFNMLRSAPAWAAIVERIRS